MARIVCPYCFERFRIREISFRCIGWDETRCPQTEDAPLGRYLRLQVNPRLKPIFVPDPGRLGIVREWFGPQMNASCPGCGALSARRLCPHCHNELPTGYGQ